MYEELWFIFKQLVESPSLPIMWWTVFAGSEKSNHIQSAEEVETSQRDRACDLRQQALQTPSGRDTGAVGNGVLHHSQLK